MFQSIRKEERALSSEETIDLLSHGEYGILSTYGEDGYPYGVPVSYVYKDNAIYYHGATAGHKLDNIRANEKVSFTVVGSTKVLSEKFSTKYESAIVFGHATELTGEERNNALRLLLQKYSPDFLEKGEQYIARSGEKTSVIKLSIEHCSGKARR